jgi:hypothetical protein
MVKVMAADASETLMLIYQIMKHDILKDHNTVLKLLIW